MTNFRGGIKRDKTDALFSELVRERANWVCEYSGEDFSHNHHGLHCSHLFGRRAKGTRWHPLNAFAHSQNSHRHLEENPAVFAEWARKKLGEANYDRVRILFHKPTKFSAFDKEIIHKHYLSERKRMRKLRAEGEMGRIEFCLP